MIHKLVFSFLILCIFGLTAQAQCLGDTSLKTPGYKPNALPNAKVWDTYDQSVSVLTPRDTKVLISMVLLSVKIDSIVAYGVYGMPDGFSYTCTNPNCVFVWNESRCIRFYGMTSQSGVFPLTIPLIAYAKLGNTPLNRPDTIRRFSLIVDAGTGISQLVKNKTDELQIFPNPAADLLNIYHPLIQRVSDIEVYDISGKKLHAKVKENNGLYTLETHYFNSGVYWISAKGKTQKLIIKTQQ